MDPAAVEARHLAIRLRRDQAWEDPDARDEKGRQA
jgi:hypothetical protein